MSPKIKSFVAQNYHFSLEDIQIIWLTSAAKVCLETHWGTLRHRDRANCGFWLTDTPKASFRGGS